MYEGGKFLLAISCQLAGVKKCNQLFCEIFQVTIPLTNYQPLKQYHAVATLLDEIYPLLIEAHILNPHILVPCYFYTVQGSFC